MVLCNSFRFFPFSRVERHERVMEFVTVDILKGYIYEYHPAAEQRKNIIIRSNRSCTHIIEEKSTECEKNTFNCWASIRGLIMVIGQLRLYIDFHITLYFFFIIFYPPIYGLTFRATSKKRAVR